MRKKLQIYISATYYDLIEERHTAVEAILQSGHIPAGVEQFFKESPMNIMEQVPTYYVEDIRHIKMILRDQLPEYAARDDLYGWVSGKDLPNVQKLLEENARLKAELEKKK